MATEPEPIRMTGVHNDVAVLHEDGERRMVRFARPEAYRSTGDYWYRVGKIVGHLDIGTTHNTYDEALKDWEGGD